MTAWFGRGSSAACLWAVVLGGLLLGAFSTDLKLPDEPRVAHTSLEMYRSGDFVVPAVNGKPFLQTPPFHYWALGAWLGVAGCEPDGTARVPSVMFTVGTLLLTGFLARRFLGERSQLLTIAVLAGTIGFWGAGQRAVVDSSLAFFTTLGFFHLAACVVERDLSVRRGLWLGAAAGFSFLCKGLPGPVILASVACLLLVLERGLARRDLVWFLLAGAAAFLLVALPWTFALWRRDPGFVSELLFEHLRARVLEGAHHDPTNFAFLHRSLLKLLPWGAVLPLALAQVWKRAARRRPEPESAPFPTRAFARLILCWLLVPLLLLFISRSKRSLYLLPIFPAAALVCSAWLERLAHRGHPLRAIQRIALVVAAALPAAGVPYQVWVEGDSTLAPFSRKLAELEASGRSILGFRLEEREEAAIAWYLRHPFERFDDAAELRDRVAALEGRAVIVGDAEELKSAAVAGSPGEVIEQSLRRRRLEAHAGAPGRS